MMSSHVILLLEATGSGMPAPEKGAVDSLFTLTSLGTVAGATGAVYVVCGTVQSVFNFNPKWLGLVVSIIISYVGAIFVSKDPGGAKYFIALLNGCLIYATATGTNTLFKGSSQAPPAAPLGNRPVLAPKRKFNSPWWS